jgi:amino acid transporter
MFQNKSFQVVYCVFFFCVYTLIDISYKEKPFTAFNVVMNITLCLFAYMFLCFYNNNSSLKK